MALFLFPEKHFKSTWTIQKLTEKLLNKSPRKFILIYNEKVNNPLLRKSKI